MDGLNHDALKTYLKTLLDADHEPRWQSGLSLLARERFRLANAQYPMASIPTFTTTAEATLATGQPPNQHGLIGTRFTRQPSIAPEQDINVYDPSFQREFLEVVQNDGDSMNSKTKSSLLLQKDSWIKTLHPTRETISVFVPYGQGGHWFVPVITTPLTKAFFNTTASKQTTRMLDQKVEELADDAIAKRPHLVVMRFAGVRGQSCAPTLPGCKDASKDLAKRQQEALIELDQRLWRLFRNYQMRHPVEFDRTTFILSGTIGTLMRSQEVRDKNQYIINTSALKTHLKTNNDPACSSTSGALDQEQWLYRLRSDSGFGMLTMPHLVQGQRGIAKEPTSCVLKRFTAIAQTLMTENKLDAFIVSDPSSPQPSVTFSEDFKAHSGSLERRRLENKLVAMVQPTRNGTIIGALFLKPPYIFSESAQQHVHLGNLRRNTIKFPLLIADKRLTQTARRQIEGASIDHIDVGPTILGLLNPQSLEAAGFPRQPLLKMGESDVSKSEALAYTHAQRSGYPSLQNRDSLAITEDANSITIAYQEDRTIWPPDHLSLSLDGLEAEWSNETQTFNQENCVYTHVESGRTWSCTLPYPPKTSQPMLKLIRKPAVNGVGESQRQVPFFTQPQPVSISAASVECKAGVKTIQLALEVPDGLDSLTFQLTRNHDDTQPSNLTKLNPLNSLKLNDEQLHESLCGEDKLDEKRCSVNRANQLTRIHSALPIDLLPVGAEMPIKVYACSFGGRCSTRKIVNPTKVCKDKE